MASRDLAHDIKPMQVVPPAAIKTTQAASNTNSVDTQGYESVTFVIETGAYTDGTFTFALYESSDNTTFTAVAAGDIIGGANPAAISSNASQNSAIWVGYKGGQRYVALAETVTGSPATGMIYGVTALLGHPHHAPTF